MKKFMILVTIVILGLGLCANLMAANQTVTNNNDSGAGSLRQAIVDVGSGEEITFDADYTITLSSELSISKNLTITGTGAGNTIIQANADPNTATYRVFNISTGTVILEDMTIRNGNPGMFENGGGIRDQGTLTLTNCTISGNTARYGGGIKNHGPLTLTNCTVSGNSASSDGGGLAFWGTLYIKNTILANNSATGNGDDFYYGSGEIVTDNGYNIVEDSYGYTFEATGDITGEQASLNLSSTLADNNTTNGTQTLKTTSSSVAIDAGSNSGANNGVDPPSQDQRGANRNGATDIGAYEYYDNDGSLPVTLTSFTATAGDEKVNIRWITESEIENLGFNIYRSTNSNVKFFNY